MTSNKNQLIHEKSPYLLQHAHNPVHWHPWGDEAFQKAKQENKPIFLSIGYSTCHWCHVMAEESFEDEEVAAILNDQYVAIKVDREERPDVDSIYMKVCQMMTGHGGWPLTIFMTPDQVPFYAGTYFPKESKYGLPGFIDALHFLADKYEEDPDHIESVTNSVTDALHKATIEKSKHRLNGKHVEQAYKQLAKQFDFRYGGFGKEPKFPMPHNLLFLLHYHYYSGNQHALNMVENTLQSMARGGIFDQIGFGFSRYATDSKWLVPHFEKMLFDNALLLLAYTACYQVTKDPFYQEIGENIIRFVEREMTSRGGAFYSAIDADSEGEEGKYYTFSYEEIYNCLNKELADLFTTIYHITPEGHFEGKNIPNQIGTDFDWVAEQHGLSLRQLNDKLEEARLQLLKYREKRVHPHVDDKILTGWNGLMIAGLAKAGKVFGKQKYIHAAEKAYSFIEGNLIQDRRLMARYRDGQTKYKAYLDDYAYLIWAAIELYEATFTPAYLEKAHQLAVQMNDLFWDKMNGGFYFTGKDSESLIVKDKEVQDGDVPSGNSTAATMLLRLGSLTGRTKWIDRAEEMYYTFYEEINRYPQISPFFLQSLLLAENPSKEVVVISNEEDVEVEELLRKLQLTFLPDVSLIAADQPNNLILAAPFAAVYHQVNDQTTVYICENFSCLQPITDLAQVNRKLFELKVDDSPDKDSE